MKTEKSCGAVVFRESEGNTEFLVISHESDGHWCFPKGHIEKNESEKETALREILEETGLEVELVEGFKESIYYNPKPDIKKEVVFFLSKADKTKVKLQTEEIKAYKWLKYEEALSKVTFENSKEILRKAFTWLKQRR